MLNPNNTAIPAPPAKSDKIIANGQDYFCDQLFSGTQVDWFKRPMEVTKTTRDV